MRRDTLRALDYIAEAMHSLCYRFDERFNALEAKVVNGHATALAKQQDLDDRITLLESGVEKTSRTPGRLPRIG